MANKIINDIKMEYRKNKVITLFMAVTLLLAVLTYLKPGSTDNVLVYIGISALNFLILAGIIITAWVFYKRKKGVFT